MCRIGVAVGVGERVGVVRGGTKVGVVVGNRGVHVDVTVWVTCSGSSVGTGDVVDTHATRPIKTQIAGPKNESHPYDFLIFIGAIIPMSHLSTSQGYAKLPCTASEAYDNRNDLRTGITGDRTG